MPVVPRNREADIVKGKAQDRPPPSGPPPAQPSHMYMLMAAAAMRDMGRLYAPVPIPVPAILSKARAEYWSQAESDIPTEVKSPATLVEKPTTVAENK